MRYALVLLRELGFIIRKLAILTGCQNFRHLQLLSHYTSTSPAMYAGSLLSHFSHILGSNSIIMWNLRRTIACIDIHYVELSSHYWMCGKSVLGCKGKMWEVWRWV